MSKTSEGLGFGGGRKAFSSYRDLDGTPVERTKDTHRYSYDAYVVWQKDYDKGKGDTVYSDRLLQWDYTKFGVCAQQVWGNQGQYFNDRKPEDIQKFLSLYFGTEIKLTVIMEGCNVSNGYPYWVFYFESN
jgi:hypothetical protein